MCELIDSDENYEIDFSWGTKRGRGGQNKEVQFYESFTYDGVEYSLYDSVYLFKEGEDKPYIGKLIKIWEHSNKTRKVKVLWFFYPSEISNYLIGENLLENELFLASGVGKGLANVNPLDRSKWFTASPWEERMKEASDQGRLVLLGNLDPTYASSDVENIVWHGFGESCTAKVVQHTATSCHNSAQAFIICKTMEAADKIVMLLDQKCLMLPNGRPVLGCREELRFPGKHSQFPGHLVLDKLRHQMQREAREAVSTSHSSQPNTIEYEMALEWRLLQDRSDLCWKMMYKKQTEEMKKLKASMKPRLLSAR